MLTHRRIVAALAVSLAAACAPPTPGDALGGSDEAFSQSAAQKMSAGAAFNPVTGEVTENAFLAGRQKSAALCVAYQDGSAAEQAACDAYPNGFTDMPCHDEIATGSAPRVGRYTSVCRQVDARGAGAFAKDGNYRVVFVDKSNPASRVESSILVAPIDAQLSLVADDGTAAPVTPDATTQVSASLRIQLEVAQSSADGALVCTSSYPTAGLGPTAIAQKDAISVASCLRSMRSIDGLDGWTRQDGSPAAGRSLLSFDGTELLAEKRHVIFVFSVNGREQFYTFEN